MSKYNKRQAWKYRIVLLWIFVLYTLSGIIGILESFIQVISFGRVQFQYRLRFNNKITHSKLDNLKKYKGIHATIFT